VREQRAAGRRIAVATSSFTGEARRVLGILGVLDCLDEVVGREQVTHPKPHPEIYLATMERLGVAPRETVVIEDSPVGVTAAEAAETNWICVANQWTAEPLRQNAAIDQQWVVYDPADLHTVVEKRIAFASCRPGE
jgi:beta-phosphoglucomutase-like phosphatase (HAD superfamily)